MLPPSLVMFSVPGISLTETVPPPESRLALPAPDDGDVAALRGDGEQPAASSVALTGPPPESMSAAGDAGDAHRAALA